MTQRNIVALRQIASENLDAMEPILIKAGFNVTQIDIAAQPDFGKAALDADLLIVLGGPLSVVKSPPEYSFLEKEIEVVKERLKNRRGVLGIGLGAQIMALALDARVYPGEPGMELGWKPISLTEDGRDSPLNALENGQPVLHWHSDTFDLPNGTKRLASSDLYPNQAFSYGNHALALQFHMECSPAGLERWYSAIRGRQLTEAKIAVDDFRRECLQHAPEINRSLGLTVLRFTADLFPNARDYSPPKNEFVL